MTLSIAVMQCNPVLGDLDGNARRIAQAAHSAHAEGADLLLLPQGALTGVPLHDLARRPAFVAACTRQVQQLAHALAGLDGLTVVLPHPAQEALSCAQERAQPAHGEVFSVLRDGHCTQHDSLCGTGLHTLSVQGRTVAVLLADAHDALSAAGCVQNVAADLLAVLGGSAYRMGQTLVREQRLQVLAQQAGVPLVSAHLVGGHDERIFDGASLAVQAHGTVAGRASQFAESLWMVRARTVDRGLVLQASTASVPEHDGQVGLVPFAQPFSHAEVWQALVLGLRDYVRKSGFQDVVLGLSGGMDSALVLALAADALGSRHVRTLVMPSVYTAAISLEDAADMAQRLGVASEVVPIDTLCQAYEKTLAPLFAGRSSDVTEENIQARVRGNLLMALSNKFGALLLTTGNKSELATGYCTLYGDMAGSFAPLKDIYKTQVYALARWRNGHDLFHTGAEPIPVRIITRAPSAELRPDQTDQDSLPAYDVLDAILASYVECDASVEQLQDMGLPDAAIRKVVRLVRLNEYKRQQAAPGVCLSRRAFACDWRYPLVNRFVEG